MDIVIADDEMIVRAAFRFMLERKLGDVHVRCAEHADSLLEAAEKRCPAVVILDWELPGKKSLPLIDAVRTLCPYANIVVTSTHPNVRDKAMRAGADRVVNKGEPPDALIRYLQQLAAA